MMTEDWKVVQLEDWYYDRREKEVDAQWKGNGALENEGDRLPANIAISGWWALKE